ncbi:MAG: hypothetical protein HYY52_08510 [Candidatus Melainabacteria bacterium]|nr:hypothetical protein [Candidatus Melainabacteria bacterium]
MKNIFIMLIVLILSSYSCSFIDPVTKAQNLATKGQFEGAIKILEKEYKKNHNSVSVKSLLSQIYSDYGLALCQDVNKSPKVKYTKAKEQFAMALTLNPYNQDAKEMYQTIEKIQTSFETNKVE